MKIVFDLDGVLRDLHGHLVNYYGVPYPEVWDWEYENKNIFEWINKDKLRILKDAPPTEYVPIVRNCIKDIEIWTHQLDTWKPLTIKWIENNLGSTTVRFLSFKEKRNRLDVFEDHILIEDCPTFKNYERIVLIDRPYNRNIISVDRINNPEELEKMINGLRT